MDLQTTTRIGENTWVPGQETDIKQKLKNYGNLASSEAFKKTPDLKDEDDQYTISASFRDTRRSGY